MLLISGNFFSWSTNQVLIQSKRCDFCVVSHHFLVTLFMINYNQMMGIRTETQFDYND